jgi:hypothetical protein
VFRGGLTVVTFRLRVRLARRRLAVRLWIVRRFAMPRNGSHFPLGFGNQALEKCRHSGLQRGGGVRASRLERLSQRCFGRLQCSRNDLVYGSHFDLM